MDNLTDCGTGGVLLPIFINSELGYYYCSRDDLLLGAEDRRGFQPRLSILKAVERLGSTAFNSNLNSVFAV